MASKEHKKAGTKETTDHSPVYEKKQHAKKTAKKKTTTEEQATETTTSHALPSTSHSPLVTAQPSINIGIIGHVDHGKTTLTQSLSGKWTDTHSEELKRGITIRLGYADITIYQLPNKEGYSQWTTKKQEGAIPARTISIVDAPGHESLMATMLSGANIMDAALLLVAANETCPQPQTREHLLALTTLQLKNIIVIQNKIDVVSEDQATKNYTEIKTFLKDTDYANAPIIPLSAKYELNIDALLGTIQEHFPTPTRDPKAPARFYVARSFDVNKPGITPQQFKGGVLGGVIKQGTLTVGDTITILPGYSVTEKNQTVWKPLHTVIKGIITGGTSVQNAGPGGSLALLTSLDPSITGSDKLVGALAGHEGKLPPVWSKLTLRTTLLERSVGVKDDLVITPIRPGELLMLNVNSAATVGVVKEAPSKEKTILDLKRPVCAEKGSRVAISRNIGQRWRLVGYGTIA